MSRKKPRRKFGDWSRSGMTRYLEITAMALASMLAVMVALKIAERYL
jgi:hypothetical protein